MTFEERLRALFERVTYKPGWGFEIMSHERRGFAIRANFWTTCAITKAPTLQLSGRSYPVHEQMTDSEIVGTAFLACVQAEEHEAREWFRFDRQRVFGPHLNVAKMAQLMASCSDMEDSRP